MLQIQNASYRIDTKTILDDVSLRFDAGTLTVLVGPNGAGKSTLLAALAGDLPCCHGQVTLDDQPLGRWKTKTLARRRAVLTQDHAVRFMFTVREVVSMGRLPHPADPSRDRLLIDQAIERADVGHLQARNVQTLSGGESSRTAFARVIAQDTPVVMLDEPTAALDLYHQERLLQHLWRLARDGVCVIVVLHDLNLAAAYADRIVILSQGRVAADGPPETVLQQQTIEAIYQQPVLVLKHPTRGTPLVVSNSPRNDDSSRETNAPST